jgi:hypothetical protein
MGAESAGSRPQKHIRKSQNIRYSGTPSSRPPTPIRPRRKLRERGKRDDITDPIAGTNEKVVQVVTVGSERRLAQPDAPQHDANRIHQRQRKQPQSGHRGHRRRVPLRQGDEQPGEQEAQHHAAVITEKHPRPTCFPDSAGCSTGSLPSQRSAQRRERHRRLGPRKQATRPTSARLTKLSEPDNPSIPSIILTALISPTVAKIVSGMDSQPRSKRQPGRSSPKDSNSTPPTKTIDRATIA